MTPAPQPTAELGSISVDDRPDRAVEETLRTITTGADLHQWGLVRSAFADVVDVDYGTPERLDADELIARWRSFLPGFDVTQHRLSQIAMRLNGDRAEATAQFHAAHLIRGAAGGDIWEFEGRYQFSLVRSALGWSVSRMRMVPGRSTGNVGLPEVARARAQPSPLPAND